MYAKSENEVQKNKHLMIHLIEKSSWTVEILLKKLPECAEDL